MYGPLVCSCVCWMDRRTTPEKCGPTSSAWRSMLAGCFGEGQTRQTLMTSQASGCLRQGVVQSRNARLAVSGERMRFLCLRLFCSPSLPKMAVTAPPFHLPGQQKQQSNLSMVCPQFCNLSASLHTSSFSRSSQVLVEWQRAAMPMLLKCLEPAVGSEKPDGRTQLFSLLCLKARKTLWAGIHSGSSKLTLEDAG